ncbi:hypothetical protein EV424DRAFT_1603770 [Suillus variegatus]|nr:hypothetical protein EV424DRAFT_1603770 [Suillus variegatus]
MTTTTATTSGSTIPPGPLILPYPGTKHAPPKFKGEYTQVKKFIKQYEKLCQQYQVTSQMDLCENITQYCSTHVADLIEVLESFNSHNWKQLKADLLNNFDADRDTKRYKPRDLVKFVLYQNKKPIRTLSEWKRYMRKFTIIGGWLKTHSKITANDHATYLWKGIHRDLRNRVESRLIAGDPLRDRTIPYSQADIIAAVETCLQRDRFETNLAYSDSEISEGETDTSSSSDSSDSESDSESEDDYKSRRKSKSKKLTKTRSKSVKRRVKFVDSSDDEDSSEYYSKKKQKIKARKSRIKDLDTDSSSEEEVERRRSHGKKGKKKSKSKDPDQIEDLVKHLSDLSIDDPNYTLLYFQALKLDSTIGEVLPKPQKKSESYVNTAPRTRAAEAPFTPSYPNNIQLGPSRYTCFGCGGSNHRLPWCPEVNALLDKGLLQKDATGRLMLPGGQEIRRQGDETFVMAQKRYASQQTANTHFVQLVTDSELDLSDHEVYLIPAVMSGSEMSNSEIEYVAYPAERTLRDKSGKRRAVFDGIYPPSAKDLRETMKREHRQRVEERKIKENVPLSAQRATGPNTLVIPQDLGTSRIEELKEEDSIPAGKSISSGQTHSENQPKFEEPTRVRPGPGAPPQREFDPNNVKKLSDIVNTRNDLPKKATAVRPYVPTSVKETETRQRREEVRLTPVSTQRPRYDVRNDDAIMEDAPAVRAKQRKDDREREHAPDNIKTLGVAPKVLVPTPSREEPKHVPRISDLAAKVDPKLLLDRILNSQIQLTAREILAVSKDLSGGLMDLIKPKAGKDRTIAETFLSQNQKSRTRGELIYIDTEINGCKIRAIYDTGRSDTPSHRFSFGSPILPKDARDIKSPCLVAFGRRNRPGPFVQEYQKFIAPSDLLASTSPPFFECEFPDLGRAIAQHHAALTAANHEDSKFSPSSPIANIGIPTPLPSPPRIGRRPISPLSLGEGTLVNIKTEPVGTDSLLLQQQPQPSTPDPFPVLQVPSLTRLQASAAPLQQQPQPSTPDPFPVPQVPSHTRMITSPAQVTLIPATGRTEAGDASSFNRLVFSTLFRLFSLPTSDQSQAFSDTRPSIPTDSGRAPFAPVPPTRASTPFSEQQQPLNLRVPGTSQLFMHVEAYECYECIPPSSPTMSDWSSSELSSPFVMLPDPNLPLSIADRFINSSDEDFDSSDDSSSTSSSEYFSQEDEIMDDMSFNYRLSNCDSQLPLGDVLIAADRITVGYTAMPDIIAYLSFEPLSNAMVADPPTYTVNVPEPFRGVHCGRDYRIALPFNGLFRPPSVHTLNLTAALICSELDAHNSREAGPEQAKFLAARPPTIYHYNKPNYPGAVVRGQSRLETRYYEWRNLRRLHLELLTAVHATLTPEQSKDCNETDSVSYSHRRRQSTARLGQSCGVPFANITLLQSFCDSSRICLFTFGSRLLSFLWL